VQRRIKRVGGHQACLWPGSARNKKRAVARLPCYKPRPMNREHFGWWSDRLQMHMPVVRYGHWGPAVLLFPTWASDHTEAERKGLIHAIAHHLDAGRVTVFSIDSINPHAWCNDQVPMPEKARRQAAYSGYVEEEVVPHIRDVLRDPGAKVVGAGASFGAFFAANGLFRRPDLFSGMIGMSGVYTLEHLLHGYSDDNVYFNNPSWYLPNLFDEGRLQALRGSHIHLITGQGQWEDPSQTLRFSGLLRDKGIGHRMDLWGHDVPHDWPSWHRMLDFALRERF
jgi:esterase/lipase superfamily enzyme